MSKTYQVFIGIDVTLGQKPVTFVALDPDQQLMAIGEGDAHDALAFAAGQQAHTLIAVNASSRPNKGRMKRAEVRKSLDPAPAGGKFTALRQAEYEIIRAGLEIAETPDSAEKSLPWVRRGFTLVERLQELEYKEYPTEDARRQWFETHADAAFWSLLGVVPLPSGTLEGRIQRQLVLRDEELKVPDAMDFFEEVTRFRLLKSILPIENIFPQNEINAWMAAHTAWLMANEPECIRRFGEPEEGIIYLPSRDKD